MKKLTIHSEDSFQIELESYGLKPLHTPQKLVVAMLSQADDEAETSVLIRFHSSLVNLSYRNTPTSFIQRIKSIVSYPYIQAYMKDDYFCVRAGYNKGSTTFKARVRNGIVNKGRCIIEEKDVPPSYRFRPKTLAEALTREMGVPVCSSCKNGSIIWRLKSDIKKKHLTSATR